MPDQPDNLDAALLMLCMFILAVLCGCMAIDTFLKRRQSRERQAIEDLQEQAGMEAYIHRDRCN